MTKTFLRKEGEKEGEEEGEKREGKEGEGERERLYVVLVGLELPM